MSIKIYLIEWFLGSFLEEIVKDNRNLKAIYSRFLNILIERKYKVKNERITMNSSRRNELKYLLASITSQTILMIGLFAESIMPYKKVISYLEVDCI